MLLRLLILAIQSKKTDYNTKINEIEEKKIIHDHSNKYITTQEFSKLTPQNIAARLPKANLASKIDIAALVKKNKKQILMIN